MIDSFSMLWREHVSTTPRAEKNGTRVYIDFRIAWQCARVCFLLNAKSRRRVFLAPSSFIVVGAMPVYDTAFTFAQKKCEEMNCLASTSPNALMALGWMVNLCKYRKFFSSKPYALCHYLVIPAHWARKIAHSSSKARPRCWYDLDNAKQIDMMTVADDAATLHWGWARTTCTHLFEIQNYSHILVRTLEVRSHGLLLRWTKIIKILLMQFCSLIFYLDRPELFCS